MSELTRLQAEADASRARLQDTISRIQDKLTLSGMVDEMVGPEASTRLAGGQTFLQSILRRHPIPLMIAAAGIGFLIHRKKSREEHEYLAAKDGERHATRPGTEGI